MKHSLQLKLGQHLALTPQLQQSIRLLQLSTLELNQELEQMLQDNPLLEREEEDEAAYAVADAPAHTAEAEAQGTETPAPENAESEPAAALDDADWNDYSAASGDDEDNDYAQGSVSGATLREHLLNQLIVSPLTLRDRTLVAALIDDLDEAGSSPSRWRTSSPACRPKSKNSNPKKSRPRSSICKTWTRPESARAIWPNA